MNQTSTLLGDISASQFIDQYWQQKPLLIRQAIPNYQCPVSAEELAGMALEDEIESRLVQQTANQWLCRYGPFTEQDFTQLPDSHWTLLVQGCNRYFREFANLLQMFDFLPAWRLDDIMVSYAADQGSVGPHYDQYDVFLLQGSGQREWQIAEGDFSRSKHLPNLELRILSQFEAQQRWLLEPGDMLYLPPGIAHYGIAQGACMTISIGFRAANAAQMLNAFCDDFLANQQERLQQIFYSDPRRQAQPTTLDNAGLIDCIAQQQFREILQPLLQAQLQNPAWMALAVTQSGQLPEPPEEPFDRASLRARVYAGALLCRDQGSRFAFLHHEQDVLLYVNGEAYVVAAELEPLVKLLSGKHFLNFAEIEPYLDSDLLLQLLNLGCWYIDESED